MSIRCRSTRFKANRLIHIFAKIITSRGGIRERKSIYSSFPYLYVFISRPFHVIVNNRHVKTRISFFIRILSHVLVVPVKRNTGLHFKGACQVFCRASGRLSSLYSHRKICSLKRVIASSRTRKDYLFALIIFRTK